MLKIDLAKVPIHIGSSYPGTLAAKVGARTQQRVGDAGGIAQFGAETAWYSDLDMKISTQNGKGNFTRKGGAPLDLTSLEDTK
ncbi:MAG: hypothetical protein L3J37_04200 [Rhodobacteraceae bacterium]|nr:hypothetical protein [Paracoccaceae bacterium]